MRYQLAGLESIWTKRHLVAVRNLDMRHSYLVTLVMEFGFYTRRSVLEDVQQ